MCASLKLSSLGGKSCTLVTEPLVNAMLPRDAGSEWSALSSFRPGLGLFVLLIKVRASSLSPLLWLEILFVDNLV